MKIAISSGHGKYIRGASGSPVPPQLDEVNEARKVVDRVVELMGKAGVGVVKFHDDTSHSQNENLNTIVAWHNKQSRDYDVSVHFNAYNHTAHGTEVLYVSQSSLAKKVCDAIVGAGKFTNRGAKYNGGLAFLNGTNKPAILLEVCFCDNTSDSNLYNEHFEAICEAIAESVSGAQVPDDPSHPPPLEQHPGPPAAELHVNVTIEAPAGVIVHVDVREAGIS
jgi:N-acetylmuramoyl-L-alanine amidase